MSGQESHGATAQPAGARVARQEVARQRMARLRQLVLTRIPVWVWRAFMVHAGPGQEKRFNTEPVDTVDYHVDIDYFGDGHRGHRLDVIVPHGAPETLPVYVYFHGGGWTSGDKGAVTKYCAIQATGGMIVVNVNYRTAMAFHMRHMLQDASAALAWVHDRIAEFGGDRSRIVLGGDSAGGQIAALVAASTYQPHLAHRFHLKPILDRKNLRGVVQHCSAVDFSVMFERGFALSLGFVKLQLPKHLWGTSLHKASRFLSPIEWLDAGFPPVFVTTSERDFFYRANLNFIARLRAHSIPVETLIYDYSFKNTEHTWQQYYAYPESQEVYRRLREFVLTVTGSAAEFTADLAADHTTGHTAGHTVS